MSKSVEEIAQEIERIKVVNAKLNKLQKQLNEMIENVSMKLEEVVLESREVHSKKSTKKTSLIDFEDLFSDIPVETPRKEDRREILEEKEELRSEKNIENHETGLDIFSLEPKKEKKPKKKLIVEEEDLSEIPTRQKKKIEEKSRPKKVNYTVEDALTARGEYLTRLGKPKEAVTMILKSHKITCDNMSQEKLNELVSGDLRRVEQLKPKITKTSILSDSHTTSTPSPLLFNPFPNRKSLEMDLVDFGPVKSNTNSKYHKTKKKVNSLF